MTFRELLAHAIAYLAERGVEEPRSESELLIREAAGVSLAWLYAHRDEVVPKEALEKAEGFIRRRGHHEPSAYILGHKEFYGLDFLVDPRVLIPRPETEMLTDAGISACRRILASRPQVVVADVGTGSGAIAVSLAANVARAKVYAVDISVAVLEVARLNCERHGVADRVTLLHGDLLEPVPAPIDVLLANLPYIREAELVRLQPETVGFEPVVALHGGRAGLSVIRRLLRQAAQKVAPDGTIAIEIAWDQGKAVASLAKSVFPEAKIEVRKDLAGLDRMIEIDLSRTEDRR